MSKKTGLSRGSSSRRSRVVPKEGPDALEQLFQYQSGRSADEVGALVEATGTPDQQPLLSIRPDPNQPRNLLPRALYDRLWRGEEPTSVIQSWLDGADQAPSGEQQAIAALRHLAQTIEEIGLIQAITVRDLPAGMKAPNGVQKLIITGERRWWAHVLLLSENRSAGPLKADQIKATAFNPSTILAAQIIENVQREGLNAVDRAAGIAALKEELTVTRGKKVTWTEVEKMLGIDRPYRHRALKILDLSPEVQQLIVDHNLPESAVRPIAAKLADFPALQRQAVEQLIAWRQGDSGGDLHALVERLLPKDDLPVGRDVPPAAAGFSKTASSVIKKSTAAAKALSKLEAAEAEQLRILIENEPDQALSLVELRNSLNWLLADTAADKLYVVRLLHGGYLESDGQPAGILGYQSRVQGQIDAIRYGGQLEEIDATQFTSWCQTRGRPGVIATVDGRVLPA